MFNDCCINFSKHGSCYDKLVDSVNKGKIREVTNNFTEKQGSQKNKIKLVGDPLPL